MPRIALIGSCVTRDMWQILRRPPEDLFFTARTSLVSIMSPGLPTPINPAEFRIESDFQRSCLDFDVNKKTLAVLEAFRPDVIILDLIDERFDILQVGDAFLSHSHELQVAGVSDMPWAAGSRVIDRLSAEADRLWADAATRFTAYLRRSPTLSEARVILHRAPWVRHEVPGTELMAGVPPTTTPAMQQITFGKVVNVAEYDALMRRYYDRLQHLLPDMDVVEVDPRLQLGAAGHMWGQSPFHYVSGYYRDLAHRLSLLGVII